MKKKTIFISLICFALFFMSACSTPESNKDSSTIDTVETADKKETENTINVSVTISDEEKTIAEKELEINSETSLMELMQGNFEVVEEGGFITSIEGVEQNQKDSFFWTYKINDEEVLTGANETFLSDGDKVVFTYAQFK